MRHLLCIHHCIQPNQKWIKGGLLSTSHWEIFYTVSAAMERFEGYLYTCISKESNREEGG